MAAYHKTRYNEFMNKKIFLCPLIVLSLFACSNENNSSATTNGSSIANNVSSVISESSSEINLTDKYGITYINEATLHLANYFDNTRIALYDTLSNDDFFSLKFSSSTTSLKEYDGTLSIFDKTNQNEINSLLYKKNNNNKSDSKIELNYDVAAAIKENSEKPSSIKDFIDSIKNGSTKPSSNDDETQAYILFDVVDDGYNTEDYQTHAQDLNSHNMIYYENPAFYYDLSKLSFIKEDFTGKGKIEDFNFNRYFASNILKRRDQLVEVLSYSDVRLWPSSTRDQTYLDELVILFQYFISDATSDEEAVNALMNLQGPIKEYFGVDLGITSENKEYYVPIMQFVKRCSNQFVIFEEIDSCVKISIDSNSLINFLKGLCNSLILNPEVFNIDEATLNKVKDLKEQLSIIDSNDFMFEIYCHINDSGILSGMNYTLKSVNNNANEIIGSYSEGELTSKVDYDEIFNGKIKYSEAGTFSFEFSNNKIVISKPEDLSTF